jgi:hypothetical protein
MYQLSRMIFIKLPYVLADFRYSSNSKHFRAMLAHSYAA